MTLPPPQMVQVTGIQTLLYLLVPAWTLVRFRWRDAGELLFAALVAGLTSAALWGRVCDGSGIGIAPATAIWIAAWIGAGSWARRKKRAAEPLRWDGVLVAILLLAWTVRMLHPLQTWALGQSDAYSHLGFLRDVLENGRVGNGDYPPAYSWVLAFPTWLLQGHPYWMARFGGAFFGAGLAMGVYALMAQVRGRAAGLAAAGLVAGCPAWVLLQKTGVGCFANQLGLLLIPAALWAYASGRRGWLALALAALAVAVPMMLLHAVLLLGLLVLADRDAGRARFAWLGILALAFALALGIALCLPPARGLVIAAMLTEQYGGMDQAGAGWGEILRTLAADFFAVKRVGYASGALDGLAAATTAAFALALAGGWIRRAAAWRLVGAWGLLTSLNVHLGLFQFTNYQREGWSLLLAAAALGALVFDVLWRTWTSRNGRMVLGAGLAAVSLAGLALPPRTCRRRDRRNRMLSAICWRWIRMRRCSRATCRASNRARATSCGPCIPRSCRTSRRWPLRPVRCFSSATVRRRSRGFRRSRKSCSRAWRRKASGRSAGPRPTIGVWKNNWRDSKSGKWNIPGIWRSG